VSSQRGSSKVCDRGNQICLRHGCPLPDISSLRSCQGNDSIDVFHCRVDKDRDLTFSKAETERGFVVLHACQRLTTLRTEWHLTTGVYSSYRRRSLSESNHKFAVHTQIANTLSLSWTRPQVSKLGANLKLKKNATVDDLIKAYYKFVLAEVTRSWPRRRYYARGILFGWSLLLCVRPSSPWSRLNRNRASWTFVSVLFLSSDGERFFSTTGSHANVSRITFSRHIQPHLRSVRMVNIRT